MKIRLNITVSESGLPALIIIRGFSGRLILSRRIYRRQNVLFFCSCERNLIITVRPFNADYEETSFFIKLGCLPCYNLRLNFNFTKIGGDTIQNFYLYDKNYNFPISSAVLGFLRD